ncbi:MAG: hypothetical protein ACI8SR_002157 [Oceanicoccus sp.]|jgi:uncharacterized protein YbjT (DUF2867 family)
MIIVTGATGNVGKEVVKKLLKSGEKFSALTRDVKAAQEKISSSVDWIFADFDDQLSLRSALEGVDKLVLITPAGESMEKNQLDIVRISNDLGVKKIVKLSGLGAGPNALIRLPKAHFKIEEEIINLGIDYAFVRPNLFMQVFTDAVQADGNIYAPAEGAKISLTDTNDIAEIIVSAVLDKTDEKVIEITGPEAVTYEEVARKISETKGKPVKFVSVAPAQAKESMLGMGMSEWLVDAFLELFDIYRSGHGAAILDIPVKNILGRDATTLQSYVTETFC